MRWCWVGALLGAILSEHPNFMNVADLWIQAGLVPDLAGKGKRVMRYRDSRCKVGLDLPRPSDRTRAKRVHGLRSVRAGMAGESHRPGLLHFKSAKRQQSRGAPPHRCAARSPIASLPSRRRRSGRR